MERLRDIIAKLLKKHEKRLSSEILKIKWNEIVGEKMALKSVPLKVEHDILKVAVPDGIWARELQLNEAKFLDLLKDYNIKGVKFIPMPQMFFKRKW